MRKKIVNVDISHLIQLILDDKTMDKDIRDFIDKNNTSEKEVMEIVEKFTKGNEHLLKRLAGIQKQLIAAHEAGMSLSSASKGSEREIFISKFLEGVYPNIFRFGSGDATDTKGRRSGQLDVVIEYPFGPSLPSIGSDVRLYLAENVAAVIEVKSNLSAQWDDVEKTASKLKLLERKFGTRISMGESPETRIPIIAVGYEGWKTDTVLAEKVRNSQIDAALIINEGIFATKHGTVKGPWSLWVMISFLHAKISSLQAASTDPMKYLFNI